MPCVAFGRTVREPYADIGDIGMKYCCSVMSKITDDHGFRSTHPSTWDKMAVNCVWYFSQQEMAKGHCRLEARFKPSLEGEGLAVPVTAECSLVGWLT